MKKVINHLDWKSTLKGIDNIHCSIGDDFILFDKQEFPIEIGQPFRIDMLSVIISTKGTMQGKVNLKQYSSEAPCVIILMRNQIVEIEHVNEEFEALFILMSKQFLKSLNIEESFSAYTNVYENPYIHLQESEFKSIITYYSMMQDTIKNKDNPNRLEIAKYFTKAFFYGVGYYLHKLPTEGKKNKHLMEKFRRLVQLHFKKQRGLGFYAEKLCLNPKYMSTIIKQYSGKSAGEWIDDRIILEVKVLLKSTNMSIRQIAYEFNFQTQSAFGKYFKRHVGVSPKEFREK